MMRVAPTVPLPIWPVLASPLIWMAPAVLEPMRTVKVCAPAARMRGPHCMLPSSLIVYRPVLSFQIPVIAPGRPISL